MSQSDARSEATRASWRNDLTSVAYFMAGFACLVRWGTTSPFSRVNLFSGGFFAITAVWLWHLRSLSRATMRSDEAKKEFTGVEYDPDAKTRLGRLFDLWPVVDLLIILAYSQFRLAPGLEQASLQAAGLVLFVLDFFLVVWIDSYLAHFFRAEKPERKLITEGPYRYARHPRYAAIMVYRVAYALIFASVIGWFMVAVFAIAVKRRIRFEEDHMQGLFGEQYEEYALKTAKLLPKIY